MVGKLNKELSRRQTHVSHKRAPSVLMHALFLLTVDMTTLVVFSVAIATSVTHVFGDKLRNLVCTHF